MNYLNIIRKKLIEQNIEDVDKIIDVIEDILPEQNSNVKKTIDDLIRYAEKIYQKKYGDDEIFVQIPIPAKIKIDLVNFRKLNQLSYKKYCNFVEWLLECNCQKLSIHDLKNQKFFNKFETNYSEDKEIIKEKKLLTNKRILKL